MAYTPPTVAEFKTFFSRDFPYGATPDTVTDDDIQRAIDEAVAFVNEGLFCSQESYTTAVLYLSAHNLVTNLRLSSQGINSGQFAWLQNSRAAGSVSESLAIPDRIMANPEYAMLTTTGYGGKFLMMVIPGLSGQIFTVCGRTLP